MRTKRVIRMCIVTIILLMFSVIFFNLYITSKKWIAYEVKKQAITQATIYADRVKATLERSMIVSEVLSSTVQGIRASNLDITRAEMITIMCTILNYQPDLYSIVMGFEPNEFDFSDVWEKNSLGSNAEGRFVPHVFKKGGKLVVTTLKAFEDPIKGSYYLRPLRTGNNMLMDPITYKINGVKQTLIGMAVPIIYGTAKVGVVGTTINTKVFLHEVENFISKGSEYVSILSSNNTYIVHISEKKQNKKIFDIEDWSQEVLEQLREHEHFVVENYSETLKTNVLRIGLPIKLQNVPESWMLLLTISRESILSEIVKILRYIKIMGLASVFLFGFVMYFYAYTTETKKWI